MNWIERLPEIKGRDLYAQNSEGLILEYIWHNLSPNNKVTSMFDIGAGDGFILSNSRHLSNLGFPVRRFDKSNGQFLTCENLFECIKHEWLIPSIVSIDIDGNDYWILDKFLTTLPSLFTTPKGLQTLPKVIIAEFNASYTDSRTIAYNPDHVWAGDSYYGFTFEAGVKLAEKHGYKVIFQIADMNMIMVRKDLIEGLYIPPVTYKQSTFFKMSERTDWVTI